MDDAWQPCIPFTYALQICAKLDNDASMLQLYGATYNLAVTLLTALLQPTLCHLRKLGMPVHHVLLSLPAGCVGFLPVNEGVIWIQNGVFMLCPFCLQSQQQSYDRSGPSCDVAKLSETTCSRLHAAQSAQCWCLMCRSPCSLITALGNAIVQHGIFVCK